MQNPREARQSSYHTIMSMAHWYTRWAQTISRSARYSLDDKLAMTQRADDISQALRDEAHALVMS